MLRVRFFGIPGELTHWREQWRVRHRHGAVENKKKVTSKTCLESLQCVRAWVLRG